ncbi:hypothetical protein D8676_25500 [Mesorhizobium sp. YM1C-6-2]|nr:hypothetical protein D8676_25500 [Mesorhizobium sp. YM1C-6-2]
MVAFAFVLLTLAFVCPAADADLPRAPPFPEDLPPPLPAPPPPPPPFPPPFPPFAASAWSEPKPSSVRPRGRAAKAMPHTKVITAVLV